MKGKDFNNSLHRATYPFRCGNRQIQNTVWNTSDRLCRWCWGRHDVYCFPVFGNLLESLEPSFQSSQWCQTAASAALGVAHLAAWTCAYLQVYTHSSPNLENATYSSWFVTELLTTLISIRSAVSNWEREEQRCLKLMPQLALGEALWEGLWLWEHQEPVKYLGLEGTICAKRGSPQ